MYTAALALSSSRKCRETLGTLWHHPNPPPAPLSAAHLSNHQHGREAPFSSARLGALKPFIIFSWPLSISVLRHAASAPHEGPPAEVSTSASLSQADFWTRFYVSLFRLRMPLSRKSMRAYQKHFIWRHKWIDLEKLRPYSGLSPRKRITKNNKRFVRSS